MKKIVKCPSCKEKMKIQDKIAKYRCPNCKKVYKYTRIKRFISKVVGVFVGMISTVTDIRVAIKNKILATKNTFSYMKNVKRNMKQDPNWSNYHKEQKEMKELNKKNKIKNFFKKKK